MPEAYGGLGLDKVSYDAVSEALAEAPPSPCPLGAHVGIGTLPIVFFGTRRAESSVSAGAGNRGMDRGLLPDGTVSGSDALGAKTTAKLSEDGTHYMLNGSKQYITNAGFADLFIVYAKVDGEHFSAFIVERDYAGLQHRTGGAQDGHQRFLDLPALLRRCPRPGREFAREVGKGHLIAFNILNIGRFKLAAGCLGGMQGSDRACLRNMRTCASSSASRSPPSR